MRGHRADKNALRGNNDLCRLCKCCCGRPTANGLSCIAVLKSGYTTVYTLHMYQAHARLACPTEYIPSNFLHCALLSRPIDSYYRLMNVEYVFSLFIFTRSMIFFLSSIREIYSRKIGIDQISSSFFSTRRRRIRSFNARNVSLQ